MAHFGQFNAREKKRVKRNVGYDKKRQIRGQSGPVSGSKTRCRSHIRVFAIWF